MKYVLTNSDYLHNYVLMLYDFELIERIPTNKQTIALAIKYVDYVCS